MMKKKFECHITLLDTVKTEALQAFVKHFQWKYSRIDGDPALGDHVYQYATKYYATQEEAIKGTTTMAGLLQSIGYPVTRMKVEHVVFDRRV